MDATDSVAEYYNGLNQRCVETGNADALPEIDRIVYYVISARCEMDMNGFESLFDQLLTEKELGFFIASLNQLGESNLASLFDRAQSVLMESGFFADD